MKVVFGIRFSSWNPAIQLEKRIPKKTSITAPFQIRFSSWNPAFQLESWNPAIQLEKRIPSHSSKSGSPANPS